MAATTTTTIPAVVTAGATPSSSLLSQTAHISKLAHAAAIALDRHVRAAAGPAATTTSAGLTSSPPDDFTPPPPPSPTRLRRLEDLASQLYVLGLHVDQLAACLPEGDPSANGEGDHASREDGAARREGRRENGGRGDLGRRDDGDDDGDGPVLAMLGNVLQACDGAMEVLTASVAALECEHRRGGSGTVDGTVDGAGEAMAAGKENGVGEIGAGEIADEAVCRYEAMLAANRTAIYIGAQLLGEGHWSALLRHPQAIELVGEARRTSGEVLDGRWRLVARGNAKTLLG